MSIPYDKLPYIFGTVVHGVALVFITISWVYWTCGISTRHRHKSHIDTKKSLKMPRNARLAAICAFGIIAMALLMFNIMLWIGEEGIIAINGKIVNWMRWTVYVFVYPTYMMMVLLTSIRVFSPKSILGLIATLTASLFLLLGALVKEKSQWLPFALSAFIYLVLFITAFRFNKSKKWLILVLALITILCLHILWLVGPAYIQTSLNVEPWLGFALDVFVMIQGILWIFFWYTDLYISRTKRDENPIMVPG